MRCCLGIADKVFGVIDGGGFVSRSVVSYPTKVGCLLCCRYFWNAFSMMSAITSPGVIPAALICCGIKLVAVMPGVVFISSMLIVSFPFSPLRI